MLTVCCFRLSVGLIKLSEDIMSSTEYSTPYKYNTYLHTEAELHETQGRISNPIQWPTLLCTGHCRFSEHPASFTSHFPALSPEMQGHEISVKRPLGQTPRISSHIAPLDLASPGVYLRQLNFARTWRPKSRQTPRYIVTPLLLHRLRFPNTSSLQDSSPTEVQSLTEGLYDSPLILDEGSRQVDWARSFHGLSTEAFQPEAARILLAPLDPHDVEVKPDGIIYLPEIKYRRVLNKAFGPGAWGLAPRGETIVTPQSVTREYALVVLGRSDIHPPFAVSKIKSNPSLTGLFPLREVNRIILARKLLPLLSKVASPMR